MVEEVEGRDPRCRQARLRGREVEGRDEEVEEEEEGSEGELANREETGRGFCVGVGGSMWAYISYEVSRII